MIYRVSWLAAFVLAGSLSESVAAADRPNILIIMADDCTFNDLPVYGGENARTPNIDRLASEGLTFNKAYLCSAMCQPCRAELYTGQYPMRNGCAWNHSASRPGTQSLPHHLGRLGYRVGLAGKVHVLPEESYPFEPVKGYDPSCTRNPTQAHETGNVREFLTRNADQPFCLVVALVEPHVPWVMGDPSQYPPKKLELPPNIADTPRTREDFSRYLAEITYMDGQVGELLDLVDQTGHRNDTLVIFTSEQGAQFPGCKWTNWDTGVHTALIARWPGKVTPGRRTNALVQYADIVPTLLDVVGETENAHPFDGTSFLSVLTGDSDRHRDFVYGMHNNIPEGPAYPLRSISDGEYHYILNLTPGELYIEKHLMGLQGAGLLNNPYWGTWIFDASSNPHTYQLVKRYTLRPAEELYHLGEDPFEIQNLAGFPERREVQARLKSELQTWMQQQGDPGILQDTVESHRAAKNGAHLFGVSGILETD